MHLKRGSRKPGFTSENEIDVPLPGGDYGGRIW